MSVQLEKRTSPRHGTGVFTLQSIPAHTLVIEYTGECIRSIEAEMRYPEISAQGPEHTFILQFDDDYVVDANVGGNDARFINHCCVPNLEPMAIGRAIWLVSLRDIAVGEELGYDYAIELEQRHTPAIKKKYPCSCGVAGCRGTLLRSSSQPMGTEVRTARAAIRKKIHVLLQQGI